MKAKTKISAPTFFLFDGSYRLSALKTDPRVPVKKPIALTNLSNRLLDRHRWRSGLGRQSVIDRTRLDFQKFYFLPKSKILLEKKVKITFVEVKNNFEISKNRKIAYNCVYIVNFRKIENPQIRSFENLQCKCSYKLFSDFRNLENYVWPRQK